MCASHCLSISFLHISTAYTSGYNIVVSLPQLVEYSIVGLDFNIQALTLSWVLAFSSPGSFSLQCSLVVFGIMFEGFPRILSLLISPNRPMLLITWVSNMFFTVLYNVYVAFLAFLSKCICSWIGTHGSCNCQTSLTLYTGYLSLCKILLQKFVDKQNDVASMVRNVFHWCSVITEHRYLGVT